MTTNDPNTPRRSTPTPSPTRQPTKWALLNAIPEPTARRVLSLARRRRFGRNEIVFHEGDPGDSMHFIDKGHVAVRVSTPMGEATLVRILGEGDHFGEFSVISPAARNATVSAVEGAETMSIHRSSLDELRAEHAAVDRLLLEAAVVEIRRLSAQLSDALYLPAPTRVLRRLLEVSETYAGSESMQLPLTQDDVAELAGTARPTANRVLRAAQEEGLIAISRGKIVILDRDALSRKAR